NSTLYRAHTLRGANGAVYFADTKFGAIAPLTAGTTYPASTAADLPPSVNGVFRTTGKGNPTSFPGDFDTGIGNLSDGPYCNKPDEGNLAYRHPNYDVDGKFT